MLLPPLLSWMMMVQFNNATSSSSLKSSFLSCIFSIFVQSLQGGPTIFWDTFCKKKKTFFNVTKGGQKIVKVCLHFSFLQVEEFFGDKRKKLSIQNLLRDPVFWLKIQLLFLSSYFFLGTGHLIAASSPPDQEFIVAVVFVVMDHNIIKHWPSPRGSMFWCSIFNANNLLLLLQIAFSPFFSQFGKKHERKIVQGNCIYSVWLFYQANISGKGVAWKKIAPKLWFFSGLSFYFPSLFVFLVILKSQLLTVTKQQEKTFRVMWNKR